VKQTTITTVEKDCQFGWRVGEFRMGTNTRLSKSILYYRIPDGTGIEEPGN
jgi:hypothetical protein